jgi:hypothetical protein
MSGLGQRQRSKEVEQFILFSSGRSTLAGLRTLRIPTSNVDKGATARIAAV